MSLTTWPTDLDDVLTSGYTVREPGLAAWHSFNTLSEYPTDPAGMLCIFGGFTSETWTGWTGNASAELSVLSGELNVSSIGSNPRIIMPSGVSGQNGETCILKISTTTPDLITSAFVQLHLTPYTIQKQFTAGLKANASGYITSFVISDPTAVNRLMIGIDGPSGMQVNISIFYIGDGAYISNSVLDNSGKALHGTAYGVTPTTGKSGSGIIFDGINDYLLLGLTAATYPLLYISAWIKLSAATSFCLFDPRDDAGDGGSPVMTDEVKFYVDGSTSLARVPYDGLWHHIIAPLSDMIVNKAWFGRTYDGASYLSGTVDELRFYTVLDSYRMATLYSEPTSYEALPEYPLADGHSAGRQSGVIRTEMDSGQPKVRTRFTARCKYPVYQYYMSRAQKQILDQFYDGLGGSLPFDFTDPDTGEVWSATFLGEPSAQIEGLGYRVTLPLEVLP